MKRWGLLLSFLFVFFALFILPELYACSVCFGNPESKGTQAIKTGIVVLLGVTALVLGGIGSVIFSCALRAKKMQDRVSSPSA